ncbi:uncharacterized protein BYT42DRAFT_855 [Radiomyces spectabilis]|uniref:uncharacterized protein n=1 Tax=Radiomyces spectabilis TaxID=64574 RepID=UPI00221F7844|nr:uncharacterized protein BYT42DRAFT_855 [Radiomyces spectabilis]KAI8393284.1 hypothetical protein BYT42DRAFT_855 [Radiomyces spectabilis]
MYGHPKDQTGSSSKNRRKSPSLQDTEDYFARLLAAEDQSIVSINDVDRFDYSLYSTSINTQFSTSGSDISSETTSDTPSKPSSHHQPPFQHYQNPYQRSLYQQAPQTAPQQQHANTFLVNCPQPDDLSSPAATRVLYDMESLQDRYSVQLQHRLEKLGDNPMLFDSSDPSYAGFISGDDSKPIVAPSILQQPTTDHHASITGYMPGSAVNHLNYMGYRGLPSAYAISSKKTENEGGVYVRKACVACKASHVACDVQRPCARCVRLNKADTCQDAERKKRGRPCGSTKKKPGNDQKEKGPRHKMQRC